MPSVQSAAYWIERLRLEPHPEGGYFRETYRATEAIARAALPPRFLGARAVSTAIYFLLPSEQVSRLHRLRSDELWHFHAGSPLTIAMLEPDGRAREVVLGPDPERGERFQVIVPAGCWFGASVAAPRSFTVAGCTVAPGFDFADFELGERGALLRAFPREEKLIMRLTRSVTP
jgi:predicted cupin superfamily sugar epimerase